MLLVVESGSTKSDWVLVENKAITHNFKTMGFNPFFHDEKIIHQALKENTGLYQIANQVTNLFFYGAGCSSEEMNNIIKNAFSKIFSNATIEVEHDLLACALATYEEEPAISCIIGTGSNSCYFDGDQLIEKVPALGYVLGDEGSGSYYGKKILTDFLYNKLPNEIKTDLIDNQQISKNVIFENIYMKPNPNVYLASFMPFIAKYKETDYVKEMVIKGMYHFMENHVCCYDNYKEVKTHFIGSLSEVFKNELFIAADQLNVQVGSIIQKPIDNLVNYHIKHS